MTDKACLTNLVSFYDQVTHLVDVEKAVDVVYPGFIEDFYTIFPQYSPSVAARGLDKHILYWIKNCLDAWEQPDIGVEWSLIQLATGCK